MAGQEFSLRNANASVIELISGEEALNELKQVDDYFNNFSRFDLESRLQSSTATLDNYIASFAQRIVNWNEKQKQCIRNYIDYMNTKCIDQLQLLVLPARILVVLTDGKDASDDAHCRNNNVIVLPQHIVIMTDSKRETFIHELFHIWSRQKTNMKIRDELYASIGYHRIPIDYQSELPSDLSEMKITNPDAPLVMKYFINLKKKNHQKNKIYKCTPIIHASRPFKSKYSTSMFDYLVATTIVLDEETYESKQPLEYLPYDQAANFYAQIGNNTGYIMHPEEILADNFVLWMIATKNPNRLRTPTVVQNMNDIIVRSIK
ncbi:unnamed protein product [Adineta steineri]|uniref:Uncharacterized protein n=3 Tax=Adineta steineri TaxID=433720 RepID=A0A815MQD8_9BILA|nr:unnamed protein product [Adineta steineri]